MLFVFSWENYSASACSKLAKYLKYPPQATPLAETIHVSDLQGCEFSRHRLLYMYCTYIYVRHTTSTWTHRDQEISGRALATLNQYLKLDLLTARLAHLSVRVSLSHVENKSATRRPEFRSAVRLLRCHIIIIQVHSTAGLYLYDLRTYTTPLQRVCTSGFHYVVSMHL